MRFVSSFEQILKIWGFFGLLTLGPSIWAQASRLIPLSFINKFEQELLIDLNTKIFGIQTINIEAITVPAGMDSKSENLILVANAIKTACSKSVHFYSLNSNRMANSKELTMRAEILASKGNDIVVFILVSDHESIVIFSEIYSIKDKMASKPLPNLLFTANASVQPKLEFTSLTNQGLDTITENFSGTCFGFSIIGSQYALSRRDLTFGFTLGILYTQPINTNFSPERSGLMNLYTGFSTELLIHEFRIFNTISNISWNSTLNTDLSQLNSGRYNLQSGIAFYISKNFSFRTGLDLCNRNLTPWGSNLLGFSEFDRVYFGLGLGF